MSDQDMFNAENPDPDPQTLEAKPLEPSPDLFADQLSVILNEDGTPKYANVADAVASIAPAQAHITTLESENATLTEQLGAAKAAQDLLAKQVGKNQPTPTPGLTAEEVADIARQTQVETEQANQRTANENSVRSKFSELYGGTAKEQMQKVATESGMTIAAIKALAQTSPQAVFRLAGIASPVATPTPPKTPGTGAGDNFTPQPKTETPKSIMGGSNTKELVDNWKKAGDIVREQLAQQ